MADLRPKVIFGGTFDPVHFGHLRSALELAQWLGNESIDLVPTKDPVHKEAAAAAASQRIEMLNLACDSEPLLQVNDIEIRSNSPSYTVFTLRSIRKQIGEKRSLILVMGMDAFLSLQTWHDWQDLPLLAHLLIVQRPGYHPLLNAELQALVDAHQTNSREKLLASSSGSLMFHELTPLGISATQIRNQIEFGASPRYLLPDAVWEYIQEKKLYGFEPK